MIAFESKTGELTGAPLHRWVCRCGKRGVWLERETVAARNAALHTNHHAEQEAR